MRFTNNFIDTKFLCEYSYFVKDLPQGKCKIYHLLKQNNIIDDAKIKQFDDNEKKMGKIYDIIININTLNKYLINYCLYDVVYLYHLYAKLQELPNYKIINELTRYNFLQKRGITNYLPKDEINKINNYYFIAKNGNKIKLNYYFEKKFKQILELNKKLNQIYKINYFRKEINMLFKLRVYRSLCRKVKIYTANDKVYDNEILNKSYKNLPI